jgi:hypothetical protein
MVIEPPVWCWRCLIAAWWCGVDGACSLPVLLSALPPYCRSRRAVELRWSKASARVASGLSPPSCAGALRASNGARRPRFRGTRRSARAACKLAAGDQPGTSARSRCAACQTQSWKRSHCRAPPYRGFAAPTSRLRVHAPASPATGSRTPTTRVRGGLVVASHWRHWAGRGPGGRFRKGGLLGWPAVWVFASPNKGSPATGIL